MSDRYHGPVVVGIDGSDEAKRAARYGAWEADRRHVPLRLVYADPPIPQYGPMLVIANDDPDGAWAHARFTEVEKLVAADYPELRVETAVAVGSPAGVLVAESKRASLVVLGTRATGGLAGHLAGSVAAQVSAHAEAPVTVLRGSGLTSPDEFRGLPVMVGVDGSPGSEQAVAYAVEQALARGSQVHAVYVWNIIDVHDYGVVAPDYVHADEEAKAARLLTEATSGWADRYPELTIRRRAEHELHPVAELCRLSAEAGLLVVGSRGHGGFLGLRLGSTVDGLVRYASVPVAVVRGRYETPR